jgi:hypothetical protein
LAVWGVLEIFNPALVTPGVGLYGLRAYLIYVPLLYVIPAVFPDAASLNRFWTWYLVVALIPLIIGVIQFQSPYDSVLNRYAWDDTTAHIATLDLNHVRITGTFSYITGYTDYLSVIGLITFSLLLYANRPWSKLFLVGFIGLVLANVFMSGSRTPFLRLALGLPLLVVLVPRPRAANWIQTLLLLAFTVPAAVWLSDYLVPDARTVFTDRAAQSDDLERRVFGTFADRSWVVEQAGLVGYGIGSESQAINFIVTREYSVNSPPAVEDEWASIILEIGPFGFGLVFLIRILVSLKLFQVVRQARGSGLAPFLISAFLYTFLALTSNLVFDSTASIFYWFLAGYCLIGTQPRAVSQAQLAVSWAKI